VWLEEGLATYVEPLARARAGLLSDERVWRSFLRGMPNGLPRAGDRGLDHTPTWGRRYWGGAIFCLLADLEIRRRTDNRRSLDDAVRGIVAAGGNIAVRWPLARALAEGDRATGVPVLTELHAKMGAAPVPVDLEGLWKRLGVSLRGRSVAFDDTAPLAAVRRAMTSRR
jgi:predicted metalloprotease with PDZ domain